ncbi:hypothetical protein EYF80_010604 [Liparis tanakae]|uniref:Uncharacterized protein n=1 Tax=Liparis tanakae TaxID=230148 RepID=A0A4Z2IMN3_9TELE|nr:hypothetical protein EYF80_010604 [Liparis tanakae]
MKKRWGEKPNYPFIVKAKEGPWQHPSSVMQFEAFIILLRRGVTGRRRSPAGPKHSHGASTQGEIPSCGEGWKAPSCDVHADSLRILTGTRANCWSYITVPLHLVRSEGGKLWVSADAETPFSNGVPMCMLYV